MHLADFWVDGLDSGQGHNVAVFHSVQVLGESAVDFRLNQGNAINPAMRVVFIWDVLLEDLRNEQLIQVVSNVRKSPIEPEQCAIDAEFSDNIMASQGASSLGALVRAAFVTQSRARPAV
jgi:hypothetical protein